MPGPARPDRAGTTQATDAEATGYVQLTPRPRPTSTPVAGSALAHLPWQGASGPRYHKKPTTPVPWSERAERHTSRAVTVQRITRCPLQLQRPPLPAPRHVFRSRSRVGQTLGLQHRRREPDAGTRPRRAADRLRRRRARADRLRRVPFDLDPYWPTFRELGARHRQDPAREELVRHRLRQPRLRRAPVRRRSATG